MDIAFRQPSKYRKSQEHVDIIVRPCHAEKAKTIDLGLQRPQIWLCNPHHVLSTTLFMQKGNSSISNAYNLCFQAYREIFSFRWWTIVVDCPPCLALSSTHCRTPQWQLDKICTLSQRMSTHSCTCTHQQDHRQLHKQACVYPLSTFDNKRSQVYLWHPTCIQRMNRDNGLLQW
jgi:hypothetical protein